MKLWQQGNTDNHKQVEAFTVGDDPTIDLALLPYDIKGSKAHVAVLVEAGILTAKESTVLLKGLDGILADWKEGKFTISQSQEDCHTAIEEALGELGKKIHTGRSRNDQVATAIALYLKDHLGKTLESVTATAQTLLQFAQQHEKTLLPGYTHMQQGMISTVGLWAGSYAELLKQDGAILKSAMKVLDKCPLGTAAGYGPSITLDRELAAKELGFAKLIVTAPAAQAFRGKNEALALTALQQVMSTLGKLASDLLLFSTKEFGYVTLPSKFCTGSSIMPQKKNPDVLELIRGKAAVVSAKLNEVIMLGLNLPGGYNRDYQLLKAPLFSAFDLTESSLSMMQQIVEKLQVNEEAIIASFTPEIIAADKATQLAASGVPFRDAYVQVKKELASLGSLTKEELLKNITAKKTLGSPGNPGFEKL